MKNAIRILTLAACFCATAIASAATYDAVTDFSLTSNPNGVWTYGSLSAYTGGSFVKYPTAQTNHAFPGEQTWTNGGTASRRAEVSRNTTDLPVTAGTVDYEPAQLLLNGPISSTTSARRPTAPATMRWEF